MKATATWIKAKQSVLTDARGHNAVVDMPESGKGFDSSYTALEMCVMSLAGCITTIYAIIADNKKVDLVDMEVDVDAEKGKDTLTSVKVTAEIFTKSSEEDARKVFDQTLQTCPVGVLFRKAGVEIEHTLKVHAV